MILARTSAGVTLSGQPRWRLQMSEISPLRRLPRNQPDGSADLAVRRRYLRHRRLADSRILIAVWIAFFAVMGWLFIAGFAGFNH
jgi:hypothetical protein